MTQHVIDIVPVDTARTATTDLPTVVTDILGGGLDDVFQQIQWAEEAIERARQRHPEHADRLFHSFSLLTPTHGRMGTEFVFASHCAELLDRVAAGEDTRRGTAAELCCALLTVSLATPITSAAMGLYMRMWQAAGFPTIDHFAEAGRHHEALERSVIDDHEDFARRKLAVPTRRLGVIECRGRHHGEEVTCTYADQDRPAAGLIAG
jgi:hypothetical protein